MIMKIDINTLPEELKSLFIADCRRLPRPLRSPWHDKEEARRKGNRRDFLCNIWGVAIGAAETPFDEEILEQIRAKYIKPPDYEGEIAFDYDNFGQVEGVKLVINYGTKRFQWWGKLHDNRPDQAHNYVIACDISLGTGTSNSVAAVFDVNTNELSGLWVCSNTTPEIFADTVVALAKWLGGMNDAFVIWESNFGGTTFCNRIIWQEYYNLYIEHTEDTRVRKRKNRYGWRSRASTKADLFGELAIALSEGLKDKPQYKSIIIYSEDLLNELFDYVFAEGGKDIIASSKADLSSGARERHGDRVVACALCVLGAKGQEKGNIEKPTKIPERSFMARVEAKKIQQAREKRFGKRYLFK